MNVLSDILCNSSPLILSSSYNAPLLSHNTPVTKTISKQNHLIESLSSVPNVTSSNSDQMESSIFHSMEPSHGATNLIPSSYQINHSTEPNSEFSTNPYHNSVHSWFSNDLIKVSENMSSDILPPVAEMYTTGQHTENLDLLEMGFPPEITVSNNDCNMGTSCISNSQSLISAVDAHGFPSSDSLVMSSFTNMNNPSLAVEKSRRSCEKYRNRVVVSQSANPAQSMISGMIPLNEHCDINVPNQLLSLTNHIDDQTLNAPVNPTLLQNNGQNHPMDMMADKLPHITLNQLDSILRINYLDDIHAMPNEFPNQSNNQHCGNYPDDARMETCQGNMNIMDCNDNSLSNINIAAFAQQQQEMLEIPRSLRPTTAMDSAVLHSENSVDSAIEQTCCFKCKYCTFVSLEKMSVRHHIHEMHLKSNIQNHIMPNGSSSFYNAEMISGTNSLLSETLDAPVNPSVSVVPLEMSSSHVNYNSSSILHADAPSTSSLHASSQLSNAEFNTNSCIQHPKVHLQTNHAPKPNYLHLESTKGKNNSKSSSKTEKKSQMENTDPVATVTNFNRKPLNSSVNNSDGFDGSMLQPPSDNLCDLNGDEMSKRNSCNKKIHDDVKTISPQRRISSHMKAWQKKIKRELGSYICEFKGCNVRFRAIDNLEYHRKCHIATSGKFACPDCGKNFDYWGSTAGHLWRHHATDMELHACSNCSFRTYSLSTLENLHKPIHEDKYLFLCDTCGKGFKNGKQLRNHRVIHDKKNNAAVVKKFACSVCCRQFLKKKFLRHHFNVVHNKQRSYNCKYCQYSTSKSSTLQMHMRQHTGEKPFACDQCSYQTLDHNSLRRHRMTHSGEKPYKCPYCTYACIQSTTYKTHLQKKHPEQSEQRQVFSCSICTFRTILHDNYLAHVAGHEFKDNSRQMPAEIQRHPDTEVLPLVEAVDISLSHGDHNMFLGANKDKDVRSYSWNENCNSAIGHNT